MSIEERFAERLTSAWWNPTDAHRQEHEAQFGAIIEGHCPIHGRDLDRLEHCGWCNSCNHGWRAGMATRPSDLWGPGDRIVGKVYVKDPQRVGPLLPVET